ncbi:MAG: sigma-70 family RNA polymerase sigma factor [Candidatus Eisenbacteria bacterium]
MESRTSAEQLESLYRSLREPLQSYLQSRIHDPDVAEDLLHDVFLKIHERAASIDREDRIESWIWAVTRNALVDRQRRLKPAEPIDDLPAAEADADGREGLALHRTIRAFLECIPEPYREALILSDLEGISQKDLATRLGLSHSGAKSRVQRARGKMAALIQQCCHLEFDHYGNIIDYRPRGPQCPGCGPDDGNSCGDDPCAPNPA